MRSSARLLLIGSLGVAILLAFAVFLALVVRDDVAAEIARLTAIGARRRDRITFLVLEAGIPAVIGGVIGWWSGRPGRRSARAAGRRRGSALLVRRDVRRPVPLAAAFLVIVGRGRRPRSWRRRPGARGVAASALVVAIVLTAIVVLGWQLASTGPLDAAALARSVSSPIVVLLPPALAFVAALLLATAMPPLLRAITRRTRRAPLALAAVAAVAVARPGTAGCDPDAAGVQHRGDRLRDVLVGHAPCRDR